LLKISFPFFILLFICAYKAWVITKIIFSMMPVLTDNLPLGIP
jgi:hypothetical protein